MFCRVSHREQTRKHLLRNIYLALTNLKDLFIFPLYSLNTFADYLAITDAVLDGCCTRLATSRSRGERAPRSIKAPWRCCTSPTRNRSLQIRVSNVLPFRSRASVCPKVVSFVGVGAYFQPHLAALNVHSL